MALTLASTSPTADDVWGRARVKVVTVTFDNSYDSGGEAFAPADAGLAEFAAVLVSPDSAAAAGYVVAYNYGTKKLQVFREAAHTHTENTAASYTQNATTAASTPAPLAEVAAAVDLSALKVRVVCIGV